MVSLSNDGYIKSEVSSFLIVREAQSGSGGATSHGPH